MTKNFHTQIHIPFGGDEKQALKSTTHLAIAAHQDDVEIMAQHGILTCFGRKDKHFSAMILTDGAGSPRTGIYKDFTNEEMRNVRITEQEKAAAVGDYASLILLNYPSEAVKDPKERSVINEIKNILLETKPQVIYTHNPADKHDTHIAASIRVLTALTELAGSGYRPEKVYGCEVWRGLDWINDDEKEVLDVSERPALKAALLGVYDSQIEGGKRYDLAALGRYGANATFYESHDTDKMSAAIYAIDLTPLLFGDESIADYIDGYIQRFSGDVTARIQRFQPLKKEDLI